MTTYELFKTQGRGFFEPVNEIDIRQIISFNPNGTCLWVKAPDYYMEVDCPDKDNMNARFEADGKITNKLFPYSFTGFMDACDWFDEQRATYRFAKLIGSEKLNNFFIKKVLTKQKQYGIINKERKF